MKAIRGLFSFIKRNWTRFVKWGKQLPEQSRQEEKKRINDFHDFVGTDQIALSDQLSSAWEYRILKLTGFVLSPEANRRPLNKLVERFSEIKFLNQSDAEQSKVNRVDLSFLRYHSIQLHYGLIRLALQPIGWMTAIFLVGIPVSISLGIVLSFAGVIADPVENSVGMNYTVPATGNYYLVVRSEDISSFSLGIQSKDLLSSNPSLFTKDTILPLEFGQPVYGTVTYSKSQFLYEIHGKPGQTIHVSPFSGYIDVDMTFQILDPDMARCGEVATIEADVVSASTSISCLIQKDGKYFVRVDSVQPIEILKTGYFGFSINSSEEPNEPNNTMEESGNLAIGTYVQGEVSNGDPDWYVFSAIKNDELTLFSSPQVRNTFSLTLYQDTPKGLQAVAYSTQEVEWKSSLKSRILETPRTRVVLYSVLLDMLGINASQEWLMKYDPLLLASIELLLITFFLLLYRLYFWLDWSLSNRRYEISLIVSAFIKILSKLDDEKILQSEAKKATLREDVQFLANLIPNLHRVSRSPSSRQPRGTGKQFDRIAYIILQTNDTVTLPDSDSLEYLRQEFVQWLNIFMREEYGSINLSDKTQAKTLPWYHNLVISFQRHWWKGLLIGVIGLVLLTLLNQNSPQIAESILNLVWTIIRYILLVGAVMAIYLTWGIVEDVDTPASRWQNTVRFVSFFLVPFVVLDILLKTGIVATLATLASSIKIF